VAAVERPAAAARCYDLAGPEPLTFADLLRAAAAAVDARIVLAPVPLAPVIAGTRGYQRISRSPRIRVEQWQRLAEDKAFSIEAAARDLDYAPRSFAAGITAEAAALGLAGQPHHRRARGGTMPSLAKSPLAPILGRRVPLRGPARMLFRSYARTRYQPHEIVVRATTLSGDVFDADLSSGLEWELWAFGSFERHFAELFSHLVRPGDRCVDVGANVGVHTIRLARLVGGRGEVIAIEADPDVVTRTRRNVALNGLANVRVIGAAASDQTGEMRLYRPGASDTNRGRASLVHHRYLTGTSATVPVTTIDEICAGAEVALIKVDVEGHEAAVVRGAADTIAKHAPSIVFEYAPELLDGGASQSPYGWLADRGYEFLHVRPARNGITGRVRLSLDRLAALPPAGGDVLAVSPEVARRLGSLVH
jgi:FkbM family methyltransferase